MNNMSMIIGRLVRDPEIKELEDNKKVAYITLACNRNFKNEDGEYDTDFIPVTLWNMVATNTAEYCKKGDLVGIKGRLETEEGKLILVAEKVTFLSSKKTEE